MNNRPQIQSYKTTQMLCIVLFCSLFVLSYAYGGSSSSQTAYAKASVKTSLGIAKNSDLDFGVSFPSDPQLTVLPESPQSSVFTVTGEAFRAYNIFLPSQVTLITGNGSGSDKQISVGRFTSSPARSGRLDAVGRETLKVGATRSSIRATQESGTYSGIFTVTVVYQ